MTLQESIKKVLKETVNESAFFRRRVDMSLMDKEFFENLNYITSIFLKRYNEGKRFDIFQFENKILNYLIDGYHNELTDGGLNDFPYDEVYEFLSNHFHDKIKDRYDTFFGNKINESVDKFEEKKLKLVTRMIHEFFDEVSFIDIKKYENKPMIRVYFDNDEYAGNEESYFAEQIQRKIYEYTGIKLIPYWHNDQDNGADFRLDAIKLKYDNEGNVINESENKKQSLIELIDEYGLYEFIKMSGLDFNQVKSILNKMDNPKEILKQYIREFVLEHDSIPGENHGSLFALKLPLSNTKYVNDIMVQDREQIAVEIWKYEEDDYGHTEQTYQYLTSINVLTNEELLSIISWMMETIEGGYWD